MHTAQHPQSMVQEYITGVNRCWEHTSASQKGVWTSVRMRSCLICQLPNAGKLPVMPMLSLPVSAQSLQVANPCIILWNVLQHSWEDILLYLLPHGFCTALPVPSTPQEAIDHWQWAWALMHCIQRQGRVAGAPQPEAHKHFIVPRLSSWECTA